VPQALQDPHPRPDPSQLHQEERKGEASCVAGEPPHAGYHCTLWHWLVAAPA
jgi:hypothetical protein